MGRPAKRMARVKTAAAEEERPSGSRAKKLKQSRPEQQEDDDRVDLFNQGKKKTRKSKPDSDLSLVGPPVPTAEAQKKWPNRYKYSIKKKGPEAKNTEVSNEEEEILQARCHYTQAIVDECRFNLGDDAYIKVTSLFFLLLYMKFLHKNVLLILHFPIDCLEAEDGNLDYIARIIELFETMDGKPYFKAQWFYRAEDTVIKDNANLIDNRRVFLSDITDDNPLNCIVSKVKIAQVVSNSESNTKESDTSSTISSESGSNSTTGDSNMRLLDLYSGCGAMSTGLCIGASLSGINLVTRWAVDINPDACKSLKYNHPETEVRNEAAEDFLSLLKEWAKLRQKFSLFSPSELPEESQNSVSKEEEEEEEEEDDDDNEEGSDVPGEEFEVERLLAFCYGEPNKVKKPEVYFTVIRITNNCILEILLMKDWKRKK
ncbi:DNA (Cytosine-5)-methyltransferase [Melia azedarach]|uniref:DNA (Cytosine-5)-methyltransferase n=1 Tax=Melia azedarach TaxID=155640 RepID=A0ACC1Y349_MELAZ|nr:DNA (Cytosine-5)-methyltransferase [Melia azedarach]